MSVDGARSIAPQLTWAGDDLDAHRGSDGWYVAERAPDEGLASDLLSRLGDASPSVAVVGDRLQALRAIAAGGMAVDLAYLDVPREQFMDLAPKSERLTTWLTVVRSHVLAAYDTLGQGGRLVVQIDDEGAAHVRAMVEHALGSDRFLGTILWQRKYSAQPDLRGRIDAAHDFLLVFGRDPPDEAPRYEAWQHEVAGKTEDATREFEALRAKGVVQLSDIPKTSKPSRLLLRLFERLQTPADGRVLEVFSDTGFAALHAVNSGRRAALLVGSTEREREQFEACGLLAIRDAMGDVAPEIVELGSSLPGPARPSLRARPFRYGEVSPRPRAFEARPLVLAEKPVPTAAAALPSMEIVGERCAALHALEPVVRSGASLVAAPVSVEDSTFTQTDLASARELVEAAARVCRHDGFIALATDDRAVAGVRLAANDVLGRDRYVGSIVLFSWRDEVEDPHRFVVVYRTVQDPAGAKIGPPATHEFANPDDDPRGAWRDPAHKGARSGSTNTAFAYRVPPYRWSVESGQLPPGVWRLSPFTGVLWASALREPGAFEFVVRVTDSEGRHTDRPLRIVVADDDPDEMHEQVPWLHSPPVSSARAPSVQTSSLPRGAVGQPYRAVLEASGGKPFEQVHEVGESTADGRRTRYWEFAIATLEREILEDDVILGAGGTAKPRIKRRPDVSGRWRRSVDLSWWTTTRLGDETPGERLARITTDDGDLVVDAVGELDADLSPALAERGIIALRSAAAGEAMTARVGEPLCRFDRDDLSFKVDYSPSDFVDRMVWIEGFIPVADDGPIPLAGVSADGTTACLVLPFDEWPTMALVHQLRESILPLYRETVVYHFCGRPAGGRVPGLIFRRFPFDSSARVLA